MGSRISFFFTWWHIGKCVNSPITPYANMMIMLFSVWGYRAVLTVTATNYIIIIKIGDCERKKHSD